MAVIVNVPVQGFVQNRIILQIQASTSGNGLEGANPAATSPISS
jgi:hypothetical protein